MVERLGIATKTSANAYASVFASPLIAKPDQASNFVFQYVENNVNAVTLKFLGSNDGVVWKQLGVETAVAKDGEGVETLENEPWLYLDVQVKSTVAATHGSITVIVTQG